jgi:RNA polymerase sigma factor (sigma-70 family)
MDTHGADRRVADAYEDLRPALYRRMLATTRDADVAADATQEAFARLLTEARAGRYPDNAAAWLYRTAKNVVISGARRASVARRVGPRLVELGEGERPDVTVVEREASSELAVAMGCLSEPQRLALALAAHGVSGEEIAARLGKDGFQPVVARHP